MPKTRKKSKKDGKRDTGYAHNPRYSMIVPDAAKPDVDSVTSTGES